MRKGYSHRARRAVATALVAALAGGGVVVGVASPAQAADATISIDSDGDHGAPQHYGSGWIYGLTENGQLPDRELLSEVGFNYNRAGGAQLDQGGGWRGGTYDRRFAATLAQYKTVESLGGRFVLLPHDLYGIDGVGGVGAAVPGNNGDWSDYDAFLTRLISDVKANNMAVEWDIWNEPDYPVFWPEPRTNQARFQQYLELWERTYNRLRSELPNVKIVGPSTNEGPDERDSWWRGYLDFVAAKNVVPDIISWHEIEGRYNGHDPVASKASLQGMLDRRGITKQVEFQVNEYAAPHQQYPAMSAWYIARLERSNIHGLRSHWGSAQNLHNDAAQLLLHEGTTYFTRGEFQTYSEYASQGGTVVPVTTTTRNIDAYATRSSDDSTLTALIGSYNATGTVDVVADQGGPVQPGADVRVIVEKVIEGDGAENRGATFVSDSRATVGADGKLSTNVRLDTTRDAYFVTIKKLGQESSLDGRLTFGSNLSAVRAGATTTVDTVYANNGEERQNSVNLELVLPAGWSATTTQQQIGTVDPGQQRIVSWQVTVPPNDISKRRVIETRASWAQDGEEISSNVWAAYSVPCTLDFLCESEEGAFTGGYLERNHDGYTGRGFIGGMLGQGARASLPFAVDDAGEYALRIRYAAGPDGPFAQANRTMTLAAGDRSRQVDFPRTSTWASWGQVTVPVTLPAGTTDVALAANVGDTAWVNLDSITLVRAGTAPTPDPSASPTPGPTTTPAPQGCTVGQLCEVETGVRAGGANIATNHAGFTGTGFIDGLVSPGASVTKTIMTQTAGDHVLTIRYAAGPNGPFADLDRTASIVVNGTPQVVTLPKTGTWGSWATTTTPITLPQGTSSVAVRIDQGNTGWINVDSLRADAAAPSAVKVDAMASTRKIAGKAYVTVQAVNRSEVPVQIDVVTIYGKKTFTDVQPGKKVSAAISSANASIPAGEVTVTATATVEGKKVTSSVEAPYNAHN